MKRLTLLLLPIALIFMLAGCGGDDDDEEEDRPATVEVEEGATVPRIGGRWTGSYFTTGENGSIPIKATIRQMRDAIVLTTNKEEPPGQMLTGGINEDGDMRLTDASDGETWTTYFGPATNDFVKVADFVEAPTNGNENTALNVIELRR